MGFREWNQPIQTFPADRADHALANRVGHRTVRRGFQYLDAEPPDRLVEMFGEDTVAIVIRYSYWSCNPMTSRSCCSVQATLGWAVTLQWISRRLQCSITTNTYRSWKVVVTATKKSQAMIPWGDKRRNVNQRMSRLGRRVGRFGRYLLTVLGETSLAID